MFPFILHRIIMVCMDFKNVSLYYFFVFVGVEGKGSNQCHDCS